MTNTLWVNKRIMNNCIIYHILWWRINGQKTSPCFCWSTTNVLQGRVTANNFLRLNGMPVKLIWIKDGALRVWKQFCHTRNQYGKCHWWPSGYSRRLSDMKCNCHDLEVMSANPDRAELGVHGTSVLSRTWTKHKFTQSSLQESDSLVKITSLPVLLIIYNIYVDTHTTL